NSHQTRMLYVSLPQSNREWRGRRGMDGSILDHLLSKKGLEKPVKEFLSQSWPSGKFWVSGEQFYHVSLASSNLAENSSQKKRACCTTQAGNGFHRHSLGSW
ncbi:mCG145296, partial [Mus musculus]